MFARGQDSGLPIDSLQLMCCNICYNVHPVFPGDAGGVVSQVFLSAFETFFGCHHFNQSRPFTRRRGTYKVCLDCGKEIPYSLATMSTLTGNNYADAASVAKTAKVGAL